MATAAHAADTAAGVCQTRRWYVHLAASAVAFIGGLVLLLLRRLATAALRRIARRLAQTTESRVFAAAASTGDEGAPKPPTTETKWSGRSAAVRDLAGRLVSPHSTGGRVALLLNFCLSMASTGFFAYEAVKWTGRVEHCNALSQSPLAMVDLAFNCFYLVCFFLRFLTAQDKLQFWLELYSLVDYCTVPPAFVAAYTQQYWLGLRFLRGLHLLSLPDVLQHASLLRSDSAIRLLQLVTIFACVWFLGASVTHVLENAGDPLSYNTSGVTFGDSLYFTIVTMSTVGFGDVTPRTDWAKTFVSLYILVALGIFTSYIPEIAGMVMSHNRYSGSYRPEHGRKHIVVCGTIGLQSVETFLANLLHKDRQASNGLEIVCMSPLKPDAEFQSLLKKYFCNLIYLEGTILNPIDCRRACLSAADAAVVLANKYSSDPNEEDAESTLRAVAIKSVAPRVRCIVQLLQYHNKSYLNSIPNWDWNLGDECVCSAELKLGLMAQSCAAPGFSTLMANLFATHSMPERRLSDACEATWQPDYRKGCANEIYSAWFGPGFLGASFAEAAAVCYAEMGVILMAVMTEPDNHDGDDVVDDNDYSADSSEQPALLVNPSDRVGFVIPPRCRGFFLADSQEEVQQVVGLSRVETALAAARERGFGAEASSLEEEERSSSRPPVLAEPQRLDPSGTWHWCEARSLDSEALLMSPVTSSRTRQSPQSLQSRRLAGHYILCVLGGSASNPIGLCSFLTPLRSRAYHRCDLVPIVIVGELTHLRHEWPELQHYPDVYIVPGSPMSRASMRAAGIDKCAMCAVINGHSQLAEQTTTDPYLVDREVVLCTLNIKAMDQPGASDLYYKALRLEQSPSRGSGTAILTEIFIDKNVQYLEQDDDHNHDSLSGEIRDTEAFACGVAFTASVLDSLLATVYYNPSCMGLIRALVTGGAAHLTEQQATYPTSSAASGTSRVAQLSMTDGRLSAYGRSTFGRLFLGLLSCHGILCFGVYRCRESYGGCCRAPTAGGSNKRIVITCPDQNFRMLASDAVFCLLPLSSLHS